MAEPTMVRLHLIGVFSFIWLFVQAAWGLDATCPMFSHLHDLELSVYSQNGEDGVLMALLGAIGITNKYYVEFGVEDGQQCNSRLLRERYNFSGLLMDGSNQNDHFNLQKEFIYVENIIGLFQKYNVPRTFDILSVDLDMFDFWILAEILKNGRYKPRIIVVEVNPTLGVDNPRWDFHEANSHPLSVPHPHTINQTVWDVTRYFGANPLAFKLLGNQLGYELVYCEACGVNCFLVDRAELEKFPACSGDFPLPYIPYPCYGHSASTFGHPADPKRRNPLRVSDTFIASYLNDEIHPDSLQQAMKNIAYVRTPHLPVDYVDEPALLAQEASGAAVAPDAWPSYCPLTDEGTGEQSLTVCGCFCSKHGCQDATEVDLMVEVFQSAYKHNRQRMYPHHQHSSDDDSLGYGFFCRAVAGTNAESEWTRLLSDFSAHANITDICGHIASLYLRRALHYLSVGNVATALVAVREGVKYKPTNPMLSDILEHALAADQLRTSMYRYAISQQYVVQPNKAPMLCVFGLGICDDVTAVAREARQRWSLDAAGFNLMRFHLRHELHDTVYWGVTAKVMPIDNSDEQDSTQGSFAYVPPCLRNLYQAVEDSVLSMCSQRSQAISILIAGPPFSGVSHLHSMLGRFVGHDAAFSTAQTQVNNRARDINNRLVETAGCRVSRDESGYIDYSALLRCQSELKELGRGLFVNDSFFSPDSVTFNINGSVRVKSALYEDMYHLRMDWSSAHATNHPGHSNVLFLADEFFSLTTSHWKSPLGGKAIAILSVTEPAAAIRCLLMSPEHHALSHDDAIALWWLYFRNALDLLYHVSEVYVHVMEPNQKATVSSPLQGLMGRLYPSGSYMPNEHEDGNFRMCAEPTDVPVPDVVVPQRVLDCYYAVLRSDPDMWARCEE